MTSSYIPQRVKRAKQQITVKLYQDQLEMLDSYGRFIDDSREYIISQALDLVFKRDKEFARWLEHEADATKHAQRSATDSAHASPLATSKRNEEVMVKRPRPDIASPDPKESA
jgi:hypothetical protein